MNNIDSYSRKLYSYSYSTALRSLICLLPFLVRAIYFLLIGWWFSAIWLAVAWALHVSIIGMLLGFWMLNRVPAIVSLRR